MGDACPVRSVPAVWKWATSSFVRTSPEDIVAIRSEAGVELHPVAQYRPGETTRNEESEAERLVQAVVAPRSELAGRTLSELDFRRRFGALVLGLWRQDGWLDEEIAQTRLRAGDVLVLQGDDEALERVAGDPGILMLVPLQGERRPRRKAPVAAAIMIATVLLAASTCSPSRWPGSRARWRWC
jgi:hypothetical protein